MLWHSDRVIDCIHIDLYWVSTPGGYDIKTLINFQNALSSDFEICAHLKTGILHFNQSKQKFQNINKNAFHPRFQEKMSFVWHNSGAESTITQHT